MTHYGIVHYMTYTNTFILMSEDCPIDEGEIPAARRTKKSKAMIEYEMLIGAPYTYDQDTLNYAVHVAHKTQSGEAPTPKATFLAKGQPCLRTSALIKRYGWGAHYDKHGKIAIYPAGSAEYETYNGSKKILKGMRSKRA